MTKTVTLLLGQNKNLVVLQFPNQPYFSPLTLYFFFSKIKQTKKQNIYEKLEADAIRDATRL